MNLRCLRAKMNGRICTRRSCPHLRVYMKIFLLTLLVVAAFLVFSHLARGQTIDSAEAAKRVAGGQSVLIDVREPGEWASTGVAAPAVLLSLSDLQGPRTNWKLFLEENRGKELILYCRSGNRSGIAARILTKEGWTTANAGGFKDWSAAGLPVRQVGTR
jgi:rhodanese-related sulfurtransferase